MNKKQLLEAVELMRATHTQEELMHREIREFKNNGTLLPEVKDPVDRHVLYLASYADWSRGSLRYAMWRALAGHHPWRLGRWYYRHRYEYTLITLVPTIMFWAGVFTVGLGVSALFL